MDIILQWRQAFMSGFEGMGIIFLRILAIVIIAALALALDWAINLRRSARVSRPTRRCACFEYAGDNVDCPIPGHREIAREFFGGGRRQAHR